MNYISIKLLKDVQGKNVMHVVFYSPQFQRKCLESYYIQIKRNKTLQCATSMSINSDTELTGKIIRALSACYLNTSCQLVVSRDFFRVFCAFVWFMDNYQRFFCIRAGGTVSMLTFNEVHVYKGQTLTPTKQTKISKSNSE